MYEDASYSEAPLNKVKCLLPNGGAHSDEPSLIPWQMLLTLVPDPLQWSVGCAAHGQRQRGL